MKLGHFSRKYARETNTSVGRGSIVEIRIQNQSIPQRERSVQNFQKCPVLSACLFFPILFILSILSSLSFSLFLSPFLRRREQSQFSLPLIPTHLIYGPVYASHGSARGRIQISKDAREAQQSVINAAGERRVRVNIKSRFLRLSRVLISDLPLRLFVIQLPMSLGCRYLLRVRAVLNRALLYCLHSRTLALTLGEPRETENLRYQRAGVHARYDTVLPL